MAQKLDLGIALSKTGHLEKYKWDGGKAGVDTYKT
jgi:hypothetical protein